MDRSTVAGLLMAAVLLAGCASGTTGTLNVQATDAPDNIGDFSSLMVEVSSIDVKGEGGDHSYAPAQASFDLVRLTSGNVTTLFKDQVPAGNYTKLELVLSKATGTLKAGGATVDVKAPKGSIFLAQPFEVKAGQETRFLFDIHVVAKGSGDYSLQPNAGGSGPR